MPRLWRGALSCWRLQCMQFLRLFKVRII